MGHKKHRKLQFKLLNLASLNRTLKYISVDQFEA